ncbi:MAG: helix-turn-helix domain-containing protein [Aliarcobacter sp.]|jgi:transposase
MNKTRDRGTKRLNKEQVEVLLRLRKKGYSYGRLAEKFNVSRTTAYNYCQAEQ